MRILGAGDNVVDRYVDLGTLYPGGNALNVAVFAARFGAEAAYLGVVGDDEAGRLVRRSLIEEGAIRVLPKPFQGETLEDCIRTALQL